MGRRVGMFFMRYMRTFWWSLADRLVTLKAGQEELMEDLKNSLLQGSRGCKFLK
jgi:hypothetical protein